MRFTKRLHPLAAALLLAPALASADEIPASGTARAELAPFDDLIKDAMARHHVPGAALAVMKDGRLVYARGYGWADVEKRVPVRPDSVFRIASVTKPLTAATAFSLTESGKLALGDRAFARLGLRTPGDPRLKDVTVAELLNHSGGWDRDKTPDPMFRAGDIARALNAAPPADAPRIVRYMAGRPLDFDPGTRYAYSNFGYSVLGRLVARACGKTYADCVKARVLAPAGARSTRLGRSRREDADAREVHYYGDGAEGGFSLEAMDSHGGWVSSAADLLRFAREFDYPLKDGILTAASKAAMLARPPGALGAEPDGRPKAAYYASGWMVRPVSGERANIWHTGSLPGTTALLVHRYDNLAWAVLFNARDGEDGLVRAIDGPLHDAAARVKSWPADDLFARDAP
jgi:N-acyl-D-amino-acid deacylase